jgi:Rrf2 family protein
MRLSSKTRYSLRILLQIAMNKEERKMVKGHEIATKQRISEAYLEQIMIPLKSAGLVSTIRGCRGGYSLGKAPEEITVLNIIEIFEGKIEFADCKPDGDKCEMFGQCFTRGIWSELSAALGIAASKITLASIIDNQINRNFEGYVI